MFTVALIGADGAGKTTVGRRLEQTHSLPIKYLYMGISPLSSNVALPTTRLISMIKRLLGKDGDIAGPPDPTRVKSPPKGFIKRGLAELKSSLKLINRLAEEWYRQILVWYYQRSGYIVLFDRHFFSDYYAHDIAGEAHQRLLTSRIHGFLLSHFYPKPNLVIFLDAPAAVLLARKGEGTLELLERRRQEYLQLQDVVKHFIRVDASLPQDEVFYQVAQAIQEFHKTKYSKVTVIRQVQPGDRSN